MQKNSNLQKNDFLEITDDFYKFKFQFIKRIYYNEDNLFGIFYGFTYDKLPSYQEEQVLTDKNAYCIIIKGTLPDLIQGCEYVVTAKLTHNKKYGDQYDVLEIYSLIPMEEKKQFTFLNSIVNNQTVVERLMEEYPNIINDIMNGEEDIDLSRVKGLGEKTWLKLKQTVLDNFAMSDIIVKLRPLGVSMVMIKKLLSSFKSPLLLKKTLETNPYLLTSVNGLGFKKVDELALKMNPEFISDKNRLLAFCKFYLGQIGDQDGHTWVKKDVLLKEASNNVSETLEHFDYILEHPDLFIKNDKVGLKKYRVVEEKIFEIIKRKIHNKNNFIFSDEEIKVAIEQAEKEQGFNYVEDQIDAIYKILKSNFSLLVGKAGCGKTSITRAILNAYDNRRLYISSCALSAMASKRISEATLFPAMTIHRTLGCKGPNVFTYTKENHLPTDLVFLDESSMVNMKIFLSLLEATDDNTNILLSGDSRQLPPIGYGNIFSDLCDILPKEYVAELKTPMRQALKSGILCDANLIRDNISPIFQKELNNPKIIHGELQDMQYRFRETREELFNIAIKLYMNAIKTQSVDDVVIIVPRKSGCINSTFQINKVIQDLLLGDEKNQIEIKDINDPNNTIVFKLGAKVMQTKNDYDRMVFNGDIGYITYIGVNNKGKSFCQVTIKQPDGTEDNVIYNVSQMKYLDLAYALTSHKCQGQSIKSVICIIDNSHYSLLDSCMLYTMLTRAKEICCLLAEPQAFIQCIKNSHNRRNTWLSTINKK